MNKNTITIILDEQGKRNILVNGEDAGCQHSRETTETTGESKSPGVFIINDDEVNITFGFGYYYIKQTYHPFPVDAKEAEKEIKERINALKIWVKECKSKAYSHTFTV